MRNIKIIILTLLIASCNLLFSQSVDVERVVTTNFPTLRAEFRVFDANGAEARNLNTNDIELKDLGNTIPFTAPICPPDQARLSLILIFDASNSMDRNISNESSDNPSRISVIKNVARNFISQLPEGQFEAAIGSFSKYYYDLQTFTTDKDSLNLAVTRYRTETSTNYNSGFFGYNQNDMGGAFGFVDKAQYKPVILFLTDGFHDEASGEQIRQSDIIDRARATNTIIYSIVIGPLTSELSNGGLDQQSKAKLQAISEDNGGELYDNLLSENDVQDIYSDILNNAKDFGTPAPCYVDFESDCNDGEIELTYSGFPSPVADTEPYSIPDPIKPNLKITERTFIEINQALNTTEEIPVTITAEKNKIRIDGFNTNLNNIFNVTDWGGSAPPFTLAEGESRNIKVSIKPEQRQFYGGEINFEGTACSGLTMTPRAGFIFADDIVFANVNQGEQETKTFTQKFCNLTDEPINITNMLISGGANQTDFGITSQARTLAAGECIDIEATFRPTDQGDRLAEYTVKTDRGDFKAELKGGGAGKPEITGNAETFADVNCTDPKSTIIVEVTNSGPVELEITNVALADATNFNYTGPTSKIIPPNTTNNTDFTVEFTPQANGVQSTDLIFTNNSDNSPYNVRLEGEMLAVNYSTSVQNIDFGTICANSGSPISKTLDLTNISSFGYSVNASSDLPQFTTNATSYDISSGNATVTINFEAGANQQYNGKITFTSECGNVIREVDVTGRINSPEVTDNTATIAAVVGTNQMQSVSVNNPNNDNFDVIDAYVGDNAGNPLLEFSLSTTAFTVPGNGSFNLDITYTPDASNPVDVDGLLYLVIENPCDVTLDNIIVQGRPDLSVAKLTIAEDNKDYIGRITTIPVTLTGDAGFMASGTTTIEFNVQFDDNVLLPTNGTIISSNEVKHTFSVNSPFTGTQVFNMQFEVLNALPTTETPLNFSDQNAFNNAGEKSAGINPDDGRFEIILADGEATTDELSASPGDEFNLPIYILDEDDNLDEQLHKELKIAVQYNYTVMQPLDGNFTKLSEDQAEIDITGELQFTSNKKGNRLQSQFAFANIPMVAKLGNSQVSPIIIKSVDVLSGGIADFILDTANFTLTGVCEEGGNLRLFTLTDIEPSIKILENPVNTNTSIQLSTIESGVHSVSVYDMIGNKRVIDERNVSSIGSYQVDFDISNLNSGNYILYFDTPTQRFIRNIIILK